jgi:phenylalanyl-tRNA synthetase beta chain
VRLGIALAGEWVRDWRTNEACDFFRLKGLIEAILGRLCRGEVRFTPPPAGAGFTQASPGWAEPTGSSAIQLDGEEVGAAGQVSRVVAEALDLGQAVWVAELSVSRLLEAKRSPAAVQAPSAPPPVKRDLSLFVEERIPFESIRRAIGEVGGPLASQVRLIDRYTGQAIPRGTYSLTFSIEYRDPVRTLTAAEAEALHQRIGQELARRFGAAVRDNRGQTPPGSEPSLDVRDRGVL